MKPALGCAPSDLETVEAVVRGAGTSFYRGMRMLPPDRRMAMYAIYAFCRSVDDIADEDRPYEEKRRLLDVWRVRIGGLYSGEAGEAGEGEEDGALTRVLRAAAARFALRQEDFLAVIDGMQMDAEAAIVAPDLATLDLYCDRVAAAVGRLSVRAFGDASAAADRVAYALGRALQLTNILRDIAEDAERGRLYLPREWLEAESVPLDPAGALGSPRLPRVCRRVAALAHRYFEDARHAMGTANRRAMRPARLMGDTYAAILHRLERDDWRNPTRRVTLPVWRKALLALRYAFL